MTDAEIFTGASPPRLRPLRPGETGAELATDIGLEHCADCGEFRGTCIAEGEQVELLCLCQGIPCPRCHEGLIRRPISDHFDEETGRIWHTSWVSGMIPCRRCKAELERAK